MSQQKRFGFPIVAAVVLGIHTLFAVPVLGVLFYLKILPISTAAVLAIVLYATTGPASAMAACLYCRSHPGQELVAIRVASARGGQLSGLVFGFLVGLWLREPIAAVIGGLVLFFAGRIAGQRLGSIVWRRIAALP